MAGPRTPEHGDGASVLELRLPPRPAAASQARAAIRRALAEAFDPMVIGNLLMVASESVSRSVMHAALPPDERIRVRLWAHRRPRLEVEALSERWAHGEDQTVRVWADLPTRVS